MKLLLLSLLAIVAAAPVALAADWAVLGQQQTAAQHSGAERRRIVTAGRPRHPSSLPAAALQACRCSALSLTRRPSAPT